MSTETHLAGWWTVHRTADGEGWRLVATLNQDYAEEGRSLLPGRMGHFSRTLNSICYSLAPNGRGIQAAMRHAAVVLHQDFGTLDVRTEASSPHVASGTFYTDQERKR